jgi:transposase
VSTSLLYHTQGLRGYQYQSTAYEGGDITFRIAHDPCKLRCAACGSRNVRCRGTKDRTFRAIPIGGHSVFLELDVQRLECLDCRAVLQATLGFADPRRTYTRGFERYSLGLLRHMTIKDVAAHLDVGWDTIKDIQKRNLERKYRRPKLKHLRRIAIDEISIGRGHRYLTVVLDLESGAVVFVGNGKGGSALLPFWRRLRSSRARVRAVAIDMSPAYIEAVGRHLPSATVVFDHFHVVKLFNERLSDFRRDLHREAQDKRMRGVLKGTRWLLLKNPDNLDPRRKEKERLELALRLNQPLATAYYMKEQLRLLWTQTSKREAGKFLTSWIRRAEVSAIQMLVKMAHTLRTHRKGILAYYNHRISTGPLEGTNTKIRVMQRQAYGLRDQEFFKLKILALHETRLALVG